MAKGRSTVHVCVCWGGCLIGACEHMCVNMFLCVCVYMW